MVVSVQGLLAGAIVGELALAENHEVLFASPGK